jgi:predicted metal-dependent hydrolase
MRLKIKDKIYEVEIIKKITNKNTYIRVKDNLVIYITTNKLVSDKSISKLLEENISSISKMIEKQEKKNDKKNYFWYLGKKYDLVYTNNTKVIFGEEKAFFPKNIDLNKWYKKQAEKIFKERLDYNYNVFSKKISYPSLTIRKMTTRWGVCNSKLKRVTLNLELIKKDIICLDYVIMHELSHFIHHDHSKKFWGLVEENFPKYKTVRKLMKEE